jgi:antitoxin (DNA-binding transcriptional repressor) of toxin-antitoxin stability system
MSRTIPIEEAAARLADLVLGLQPGDEIQLTAQDRPVARIVPEPAREAGSPRGFGACKGMLIINAEDSQHLDDFKDYME